MKSSVDLTVVFEPLPAISRGGSKPGNKAYDWSSTASTLRTRPKQWARVMTAPGCEYGYLRTVASNLAVGGYAAFQPAHSFETVCTVQGQEVVVYARYVGAPARLDLRNGVPVESPLLCTGCTHPKRLHEDDGCTRCNCMGDVA